MIKTKHKVMICGSGVAIIIGGMVVVSAICPSAMPILIAGCVISIFGVVITGILVSLWVDFEKRR